MSTAGTPSPSSTQSTSSTTATTPASSATTQSSASTTSTPSTSRASSGKMGGGSTSASNEEKVLNRYTGILLADGSQKKLEMADHLKRLAHLRKEADNLEKTDWMYEPVEKLLGK